MLVRISQEAPESDLDAPARAVRQALADAYGQNPILESSSEIVGPIVGAELRQKAILLTVLGLLFQLIYIAARFKGGIWGVGATIAALHDVLIALGVLAFFNFEITLNVIAALLTLVGYSVNDTIVIFDRARENLAHRRKDPMAKILNDSLNQTLTRTIISNGTTFLAVLGLFLFGGRGPARVRPGDGGRHHRGDLLDALHRGAPRELVVRAAGAGGGAGEGDGLSAAGGLTLFHPRGELREGAERQPYPGTPRRQQHGGGARRRGSAPQTGC